MHLVRAPKRWLLAIDIVDALKRAGSRPLLVARGGVEPHGEEVMARARNAGLKVHEHQSSLPGPAGLLEAVECSSRADVVLLKSHLEAESRKLLFRGAAAVLANSGHEPFGLVGLEAMAAGGVACTGCSGEDYAVQGDNALVLERNDPDEFIELFFRLRADPNRERALRRSGRSTARRYCWQSVIRRALLPRLETAAA